MDKNKLLAEVSDLISSKKIITPIIKQKLFDMGFKVVTIGAQWEHCINSKELLVDFYGYDIAIGLAARAISYGCGRKFSALVIKLS